MKHPLRRFLPLMLLVALTSVFALAGGNSVSCEGGCFGPACVRARAAR